MTNLIQSKYPVQPNERIDVIDILRGFAVFGILVANMASYSGHLTDISNPGDMLDHYVLVMIRFLITAKFYSLFSFLFGWGMSIQMNRSAIRGIKFTPLYIKRLTILVMMGIAHGIFIWTGDILTLYAILGFLLLIIRNRSEKFLIAVLIFSLSFAILIRAPWETISTFRAWYENITSFMRHNAYPDTLYTTGAYTEITRLRLQEFINGNTWLLFYFGNVFGMFVLGLIVGKRKIFQELDKHSTLISKVFWFALLVGVIFNTLFVWMDIHPGWRIASWIPPNYRQMIQRTFYTIGAPALMLAYCSGIILLSKNNTWRQYLLPLGNVGRMALTNYLLQSVVFTLIFYNYGLGLYGQISPTVGLFLTIGFFILQINLSRWWFDHYRFGPMEWIWRTLTYGKIQPLSDIKSALDIQTPNKKLKIYKLAVKRNRYISLATLLIILLILLGTLFINWSSIYPQRSDGAVVNETIDQESFLSLPDHGEIEISNHTPTDHPLRIPKYNKIIPYENREIAFSNILSVYDIFDVDQALKQVEIMTNYPYLGRQAGSPEGYAVGEYIAGQFEKFGLKPFGDDGTYFQNFSVAYTPIKSIPTFKVQEPDGKINNTYTIYQHYSPIIRWYVGEGSTLSTVYWVNECTKDDFAEIDVVGKIALCEPGDHKDWLVETIRNVREHGASGLLLITDPAQRPPDFASPTKDIWIPETIPAFWIYPELLRDLLAGTGMTMDDLILSTETFPLETQVQIEVAIDSSSGCPGSNCQARNILGILPGRDPMYADEIVILGAHYDHMGQGPDGTIWRGANDDATGVSILLEIARSWEENNYRPRRSVLFAAWDAEELGLLGSRHYIQSPPHPLDKTHSMIQLDMVGIGDKTLSIDGDNDLSEHLQLVAGSLDIPTNLTQTGGSDHIPFLEAGIQSSLLIWEGNLKNHYHQPSDTVEKIDPEKLIQVALVVQTTLLDIVESEPAIKNLLSIRAQTAESGDLSSFLSTSTKEQNDLDHIWFNDLMSLSPTQVRMEPNELIIIGDEANASLNIQVDYFELGTEPLTKTHSATLPTHFSMGLDGWKWDGPDLLWHDASDLSENSSLAIGMPSEANSSFETIAESVYEYYRDIVTTLDLPGELDAKLYLMPDKQSLQASTAISLPNNQHIWVGPGTIKLIYTDNITSSQLLEESVVKLVLADSGLNENIVPWLWHGLPTIFQERSQPIAVQERYLPNLDKTLINGEDLDEFASYWAATDYLYNLIGWQGLGQFITQLGKICQESGCHDSKALDTVLLEILKLDSQSFEQAWRDEWRMQLQLADSNLNQVMSTRSNAIAYLDQEQFLSTINRDITNLYDEERIWFEEVRNFPSYRLDQDAHTIALLEDGSILARVLIKFYKEQSADNPEYSYSPKILFSKGDSGYKWSGSLFEHLNGDLIVVKYPIGKDDLARELLSTAEEIYQHLATSLNVKSPIPISITLYEDADDFASSISPTYPKMDSISAWTHEGCNIKIKLDPDKSASDYTYILAKHLSRNLLYQVGISREWLINGISSHLSIPYDQGRTYEILGTNISMLMNLLESGNLSALNQIQPAYRLPEERQDLIDAQSWDAVDFLISSYGWPNVLDIFRYQSQGMNFEDAFRRSTGANFDVFEENWIGSLRESHLLREHVEIAIDFDEEKAINHVQQLTRPELAGRKAGTLGAQKAAAYIADKFREFGLIPAVNQIDSAEVLSLRSPGSMLNKPIITGTVSTYHQTVPITLTVETAEPTFDIVNNKTSSTIQLTYRIDYRIIQPSSQPEVTSPVPLVWVGREGYQSTDIQGAIVLRKSAANISEEINDAIVHGASGLLIIGSKSKDEDIYQKSLISNDPTAESTIPVIELTQDGLNRILDIAGQTYKTTIEFNGIYPLEISIRLTSHQLRPETTFTSNVLALMPGSDPLLGREVIIIGAHYDHVGDDSDGTRYSGANDNASGIATLLEIARLWHESGFTPKRSVLFAAWGAQEMGNRGSDFYIDHPAAPLELTKMMIQLDGVGGGDGFNLGAQATLESDGYLLHTLDVVDDVLGGKVVVTEPYTYSDHLSFDPRGIPTVLLSWRLANEDNLPDRLANKVHPERLAVSGRVASLLLMTLSR